LSFLFKSGGKKDMSGPGDYDPRDFGADGIRRTPDWRGSGYDHYTAWGREGGQISWDVDPNGDYLDGSIHMTDMNVPGGFGGGMSGFGGG
jgi:hypothetical protein